MDHLELLQEEKILKELGFIELSKDVEYFILTDRYYISVNLPMSMIKIEHYKIERTVRYDIPHITQVDFKNFLKYVIGFEEKESITMELKEQLNK